MKKGIPTHTFFRVVFFRHKGSLTICEVSRRVLRDAFLAVVTPGHYPLLPSFFFDSRPPCGGRKKEIPPTGVPSPKGGRTYSSGKTPKERSSPYNNVVACRTGGGTGIFGKKNLSPSYPTFFMPR